MIISWLYYWCQTCISCFFHLWRYQPEYLKKYPLRVKIKNPVNSHNNRHPFPVRSKWEFLQQINFHNIPFNLNSNTLVISSLQNIPHWRNIVNQREFIRRFGLICHLVCLSDHIDIVADKKSHQVMIYQFLLIWYWKTCLFIFRFHLHRGFKRSKSFSLYLLRKLIRKIPFFFLLMLKLKL